MQIASEIPRLVHRQCGGWLALAPRDASLQIGVWADSEQEAIEKYRTTLDDWNATLAQRGVAARADADAGIA